VVAAVADRLSLALGEPELLTARASATATSIPRSTEDTRGARAWLWTTIILTIGALVIAGVLAPGRSATPIRGLAWLLFFGSSVHVASTGWLYTLPDVRRYARQRPTRYVWIPLGLIVAGAATAATIPPATLTWLLLPYFAWQFFHFQKQNVGMAALAAASHRLLPLRPAERQALVISGVAGIAGLLANPGLLQLGVHIRLGGMYETATFVFVAAVGAGLLSVLRRPRTERPLGFSTIYVLSLVFSLPVFIFRSPYAAVGGMTIAHGLQYLLLIGLVAAGSARGPGRVIKLAVLGNVALVGGALLSGASHLHGSAPAVRLLFGAYLGAVMAHFVIDAGLWRLRDTFPRAFMSSRVPYLVPTRPIQATDGSSTDIG
jgi:hypothetical protein